MQLAVARPGWNPFPPWWSGQPLHNSGSAPGHTLQGWVGAGPHPLPSCWGSTMSPSLHGAGLGPGHTPQRSEPCPLPFLQSQFGAWPCPRPQQDLATPFPLTGSKLYLYPLPHGTRLGPGHVPLPPLLSGRAELFPLPSL